MSRERSKGTAGQDGVEMGERSTLGQKPGYNGLCSYTQKITSCFGLDGKARVRRKEGGVVQGAEISSWNIWHAFVCVACAAGFFFFAKGEKLCFPVHVCVVFVSACVGWMTVLEGSVALQQNSMSSVTLRSMCPHVCVWKALLAYDYHTWFLSKEAVTFTHARREDKGVFVNRLCFKSN